MVAIKRLNLIIFQQKLCAWSMQKPSKPIKYTVIQNDWCKIKTAFPALMNLFCKCTYDSEMESWTTKVFVGIHRYSIWLLLNLALKFLPIMISNKYLA